MWIRYSTLETLLKERSEAVGVAHALEQQVVAQKGTLEWLTFRLTQLEHERAQLIFNYMGVKITTPELDPAPTTKPISGTDLLNDVPTFNDVGDEEAARMGLDWDAEGRVTVHGKAIG